MKPRRARVLKRYRLHATPVRVVSRPGLRDESGWEQAGRQEGGTLLLNPDALEDWAATYGHEVAHLLDDLCGFWRMWNWTTEQREVFANALGPALIDWLRAHGGRVPRKP